MYKLQRRDELDRQIEQLALLPSLAPMVGRLQCFRGISLHSAMVLATEIVDWRRFERPRSWRAISASSRARTRAATERGWLDHQSGNTHCRMCLSRRRELSPPPADERRSETAAADNRRRSSRMRGKRSSGCISVRAPERSKAVADRRRRGGRELVGFLWAVMQDLDRRRMSVPVVSGVWRRGSMSSTLDALCGPCRQPSRNPEPTMSQLPTNPILARCRRESVIGAYQQIHRDAASRPRRSTTILACS